MITGIIRRMDELGRVVIPKDIRRVLNLHEGDPLEINVDKRTIVLRKYVQRSNDWYDACMKFFDCSIVRNIMRDNDVKFFYKDNVTTCVISKGKRNRTVGNARWNKREDAFDPTIGNAIALCRAIYGQDCDYVSIMKLEG